MSIDEIQCVSYETLSDERLCALAHAGDRDAEEILVKRYNRLVRTLARPYYLAGGVRQLPHFCRNMYPQPAVLCGSGGGPG